MNKHVSVALNLRDGFKNKALESFAGLHFMLDGLEEKPIYKDDGWCVFINLSRGNHSLLVASEIFVGFVLNISIDDGDSFYMEYYHTLVPTRAYPFGRKVLKTDMLLKKDGKLLCRQDVYISFGKEQALKLAQDGASAGANMLKLYSAKKTRHLSLPAQFMVKDGANSEICSLTATGQDELFGVNPPIYKAHSRGTSFIRVQCYTTDTEGRIFLAMESSSELTFFLENNGAFLETKKKFSDGKSTVTLVSFSGDDK